MIDENGKPGQRSASPATAETMRGRGFFEKVAELKHRTPTTELERVLHDYSWADSDHVLDIVMDNWRVLREADLLEEAFLEAWSTQKEGVHNWTMPYCHRVFESLDRSKLLAAGAPLPAGDFFTVYRGVAGVGVKRRVRGYSWTGDLEVAKLFAELRASYGLANPAVYSAVIFRRHVLAYLPHIDLRDGSGRSEEEYLIDPRKLATVRLVARVQRAAC